MVLDIFFLIHHTNVSPNTLLGKPSCSEMNPFAYLYTKYKDTRQWGACPRGAIIMPLWIIILIGFGDLLYINEPIFLISIGLIWLILYLLIYSILPKSHVISQYKSWQKRYRGTSNVWAILYWIICIIIAFVVLICRGR